jgi:hypothetical protein
LEEKMKASTFTAPVAATKIKVKGKKSIGSELGTNKSKSKLLNKK